MVMTYNSLVQQTLDYLDRTDIATTNEIPNFIYQAEQRICRESKTLGIVMYVTSAFTPSVAVYQKPANWRRNITLNFGTGTGNNTRNQIVLRSYEFLRDYWPDDTQTGQPQYYCDYGFSNYLVAPTPDMSYPFEFAYLALPEPISAINQTNWLTNYAPDVLLYATLLEATPYLKDDERVPIWERYYQRGLESMNTQDDLRLTDRASNRSSD